jgi:hypothetical protein
LAVAVIHGPAMLILDEPTSGVDPIARDSFWELAEAYIELRSLDAQLDLFEEFQPMPMDCGPMHPRDRRAG